jgi:tripartite-type tricarboxylate transporter receptor subunit TctC
LPARSQDFYAGKTISMSTHSTSGAGYDTYLRLLSRHMGKYIPGRPTFIVLNQPGAGGLTALNYAARVAPQDGTFLTIVSQGPVGGRGDRRQRSADFARKLQVARQFQPVE